MTASTLKWHKAEAVNRESLETWETQHTKAGRFYVATELPATGEAPWALHGFDDRGGYGWADCSSLEDAKRLAQEWEAGPGVQP